MIIDVSSNNPSTLPSWCTGVIIKATQGISYVDPYMGDFVNQAESRGIPYAFYHYLTTDPIAQQAEFFNETIAGHSPVFTMFDLENSPQLARMLPAVWNLAGEQPVIYCSLDLCDAVPSSYRLLPAYWTGDAATAWSQVQQRLGARAIGVQWTDNYQGYDAYYMAVNFAPPAPAAPPAPPAPPAPVPSTTNGYEEVGTVNKQTLVGVTGSNSEGWLIVPQPCTIVSVIPHANTDPAAGPVEPSYYPSFTVFQQANPIICWRGAKPNSNLVMDVFWA